MEEGPSQAPQSAAGAPQLTRVLSQKDKAPLETSKEDDIPIS